MQSVADSIRDNKKSIREYTTSISEYYTSALTSVSALSKETASEATNLIDRNIKVLSEGGLMGLSFDLTPNVPQSAVDKQREENEQLEAEMQEYYDAVEAMQKKALDLAEKKVDEGFENTTKQIKDGTDEQKDIIEETGNWIKDYKFAPPSLDKDA